MITSTIMRCADRVIRDVETNSISVINIIEGIIPEGLPILMQRLMVFVLLHRIADEDPAVIPCKLRIAIGDNDLNEYDVTVNFEDKKRNRTILKIEGLIIPTFGDLELSFWYNEELLNKYVLTVAEPRRPTVEVQPDKA